MLAEDTRWARYPRNLGMRVGSNCLMLSELEI